MSRSLPILTLLTLTIWLGACVTAAALQVGVADQTPAMFSDLRFQALAIRYARLDVAWNAISQPAQAAPIAVWLEAARSDGVAPLITFDHSEEPGWHHKLPSVTLFAREFRRFRARYPWVMDFAAWNEANYCGEATCHHPTLVAGYYKRMRAICGSCRILGAELLDEPNTAEWVGQFRAALHGSEPEIWGLHNYIGANRLQAGSTLRLLDATHAPVWFTETGGVVSRHNHSKTGFPQSAGHAALVTRFLFARLARLSPRVKRIYIYQWDGGGPLASWDSGLIAPNGQARPAYDVFVQQLAEFDQLPRTFAAQSALTAADASF